MKPCSPRRLPCACSRSRSQSSCNSSKLPALKYLFLAGEPLDEPTARWVSDALGGVAIVDNYWQTESGWPIPAAQVGIEDTPRKFGSPSFPVYGFNVKLKSESWRRRAADEKAVLVIEAPLPPGR